MIYQLTFCQATYSSWNGEYTWHEHISRMCGQLTLACFQCTEIQVLLTHCLMVAVVIGDLLRALYALPAQSNIQSCLLGCLT